MSLRRIIKMDRYGVLSESTTVDELLGALVKLNEQGFGERRVTIVREGVECPVTGYLVYCNDDVIELQTDVLDFTEEDLIG